MAIVGGLHRQFVVHTLQLFVTVYRILIKQDILFHKPARKVVLKLNSFFSKTVCSRNKTR